MLLQTFLRILGTFLLIYTLLLSLRILLTWFGGPSFGRAWHYLRVATDPYLNIFRRIKFLHLGNFDLTPLAAILTLVIVQNIIGSLSLYGFITLGIILAIIVRGIWQSAVWILLVLALICVVRIISLYVAGHRDHPIWHALDMILQPMVFQAGRLLNRSVEYLHGIFIALGAIIAMWVLGSVLINVIVSVLFRLPI